MGVLTLNAHGSCYFLFFLMHLQCSCVHLCLENWRKRGRKELFEYALAVNPALIERPVFAAAADFFSPFVVVIACSRIYTTYVRM